MSLEAYVACAASRNVLDFLVAERRRRRREAAYATELVARTGSTLALSAHRRTLHVDLAALASTRAERQALAMWLCGEREADAFARALGLSHLALDEQRREVKRFKDRMRKRLRLLRRAIR